METMHTYIGTKVIKAFPMTRKEYNDERGWALPANENGDDPGYLGIYPDSDSNTEKYQGYVSWSPKKQFEAAYADIGQVDHLPPFQQRVLGELVQLKDSTRKLKKFFGTELFYKLDFQERSRMEEQHRIMNWYKDVLVKRVARFMPA